MRKLILLSFLLFSVNIFAATIPDRDSGGNIINISDAFSSAVYDFRGIGKSCTVAANTTTTCEYTVTHAKIKFNGIHIINASVGDSANLKILDTATGTYSTIANSVLNQFGFNWYLTASDREILPYASELQIGMRIVVEFINSGAAKTVYFNYFLHE